MTAGEIRVANSEIIAAGVGFRPGGGAKTGVCAADRWAVALAVKAQQESRLRKILDAFEATRSSLGADRYIFETLFRCYVIDGDFDDLDQLLEGDEVSVDEWRFLAEPLAADVLAKLPARHIDRALKGCLRQVIDTAAPPEPVIAACQRLSLHPEVHADDIAYIRILQGRFEAAEGVFADLPKVARESKPAHTGRAATHALIAMLGGDHLAARHHIDATIAAEKAGTRKRNVFPEHAAFVLSLLALVRLDTPESNALLQQLLRTAERRDLSRDVEVEVEVEFAVDAARVQAGLGNPSPALVDPMLRNPAGRLQELLARRERQRD